MRDYDDEAIYYLKCAHYERENMAKDMPAAFAETERLPWEADYYELRLIGAEEKPNKFYHDEAYIDDRTGDAKPADNPQLAYNWCLKFEVAQGEKKGDWLFVNFISKYFRFKKDGKIVGKLPEIAMALDPTLTPAIMERDGIDIESQVGQFCRGSIKPKENGKYADVTAWAKTKLSETDQELIKLGATEVKGSKPDIGDSDIPF